MARINNAAAVLTLLAFVVASAGPLLSGAAEDCSNDINTLATHCYPSVQREGPAIPPSPECCDAIRDADMPCVCANITEEIEKLISMEKAVDVCAKCGRPLEHGSKCGSFTVPMA